MKLEERIRVFARLGEIIRECLEGKPGKYAADLNKFIDTQHIQNPWFTSENVRFALDSIAGQLTESNLVKWTSAYPGLNQSPKPVKVAVIMAGNIPLVGFHDFLSVLITGNDIIVKTSSKDRDLIQFAGKIISDLEPAFSHRMVFTDNIISGFDAVIATGSDNSSRYFEYYFRNYPGIIRKNRNSIAIIEGNESIEELEGLGADIFSYFGLGCRNVSKLYVPDGYDFSAMIKSWNGFAGLTGHSKYANNYDFNKAVFLVNREDFMDTGFVLLKQESALASPVGVLYYQYYKSDDTLYKEVDTLQHKIQCIAGHKHVPFGKAQMPALWDYADSADTIEFLLKKNLTGIL